MLMKSITLEKKQKGVNRVVSIQLHLNHSKSDISGYLAAVEKMTKHSNLESFTIWILTVTAPSIQPLNDSLPWGFNILVFVFPHFTESVKMMSYYMLLLFFFLKANVLIFMCPAAIETGDRSTFFFFFSTNIVPKQVTEPFSAATGRIVQGNSGAIKKNSLPN